MGKINYLFDQKLQPGHLYINNSNIYLSKGVLP